VPTREKRRGSNSIMAEQNVIWSPHPGSQELFLPCPADEALISGNRGGGKSQPLDSLILTPSGFVPMGSLKVHDTICNPDGTNQEVQGIYPQGTQEVYRLFCADKYVECTLDHLWRVHSNKLNETIVVTTKHLIDTISDGYLLAVYKGIGRSRFTEITSIESTGQSKECQCIKVSSENSLYITDNFIVTHNTDVLLMDFLQHVGQGFGQEWRGILFREEYTQLTDIINKSMKWISQIFPGAKYNGSEHKWTFPEGEQLYLRYMRVPSDYWNYHGHEYSIKSSTYVLMGDNSYREAKDVKVGDFLQTLQGPKKVNKVFRYSKPAIRVSVLDEDSRLVGEQLQGIMHPVLTTDGWQRPGLSCLSQISEQSQVGKSLIKEVSQFLSGVHQEILQTSALVSLASLETPISRLYSVQYSCLYQTYSQFLGILSQSPLALKFHPYKVQGIPFGVFLQKTNLETYELEFLQSHAAFVQLLLYCELLIVFLHQTHLGYVRLLQSTLYYYSGAQSLQSFQSGQEYQQYPFLKGKDPLLGLLCSLLGQDQTVWSGTYAYVQTLMHKGPSSQGNYRGEYGLGGVSLPQGGETSLFPSPSQNGVLGQIRLLQKRDAGYISTAHTHSYDNYFSYTNPYRHESVQKASSSFSSVSSFACSPCESPLEMVDFEVEDVHHYITRLSTRDNVSIHDTSNKHNHYDTGAVNNSQLKNTTNSQQHIINCNCWIGFEELTNWATDECYKIMMSCNRSANPDVPKKYRASCNPSGPGHCVPFGEVLTPTGWKDIKDMLVGDAVFTVNSNGTLVSTSVAQVHKENYVGELKEVNIKGSYLCCTPGHKMPKIGGVQDNRNSLFTLLPMNELPGDTAIIRTVNWEGTKLPEMITVPKREVIGRRKSRHTHHNTIPYTKYLQLLGWFLSEGGTGIRDEVVAISKSKKVHPEQYAEIDTLLTECGFYRKGNALAVYSPDWWQHFNTFGSYTDKYIPEEIKNSTKEELSVLFSSLMRGDGSWKKLNKWQDSGTYWTTSKQLADDVSEIALKLGFRVRCLQGKRSHQKLMQYSVTFRSTDCTKLYTGNHRYNVATTANRKNVQDVPFSGEVYCIGVEDTHTFILRQKGSVWISGNSWVKQRFIDIGPPLKMYTDPLTGKTRVNIPSSLKENTTLLEADPTYEKTILAAAADDPVKYKAWVLGEWDIIAGGALTDVWEPKMQVLPTFQIPRSWKIYRSFDWGSTSPWAVTYGAECNGEQPDSSYDVPEIPAGSIIIIDEIYGWTGKVNEGDQAVSQEIAERVLAKDAALELEYGCRVYNGPADTSIYEVRDGTSIGANLAKHGCHWTRSYKGSGSRVSGLALIRTMLAASKRWDIEKPGLYFFATARHHIRTFPLLQYDEKKTEDVDTRQDDHLYDCLVGDTLVQTDKGTIPIQKLVGTTGKVQTINGDYTEFYDCRLVRKASDLVRITFEDDSSYECTFNHEFLTTNGMVKAGNLLTLPDRYCIVSHPMTIQGGIEWLKSKLSQKQLKSLKVKCTGSAVSTFKGMVSAYIGLFTNTITGKSLQGTMCTTLTRTNPTIDALTLNSLKIANICHYIKKDTIGVCQKNALIKQPNGTVAQKDQNGIQSIMRAQKKPYTQKLHENALSVTKHMKRITQSWKIPFVQINVNQHTGGNQGLTMLKENVSYVPRHLQSTCTTQEKHVVAHAALNSVLKVKKVLVLQKEADVYCLTANGTHSFALGNGVVVANSCRYLLTRKLSKMKRRRVRN